MLTEGSEQEEHLTPIVVTSLCLFSNDTRRHWVEAEKSYIHKNYCPVWSRQNPPITIPGMLVALTHEGGGVWVHLTEVRGTFLRDLYQVSPHAELVLGSC